MINNVKTQEQITAELVAQAATATAKAVFEAAQAAAVVVAKDNAAVTVEIAVIKTEMTAMKTQQLCFETEMKSRLDGLDPKFEKIIDKLEELSKGRPSWAVTLLLSALFGLCSGLIMFTATH